MNVENVNIVVHGHDPSLSEMICEYADSKEMIDYAKSMGAKGITVSGVCCTSNEVAMRRGIPMAGNFLQQENVVLTGACEAIVVDVQCIFPALGPLPSVSILNSSQLLRSARCQILISSDSMLRQQARKCKADRKTCM